MMTTIFLKSIRCHTFSKLKAQYEVNGDNKIFMQVYHESSNEEKAIGGLLMATQNFYLSNFGAGSPKKCKSYALVIGPEFLYKYPAPCLELNVGSL